MSLNKQVTTIFKRPILLVIMLFISFQQVNAQSNNVNQPRVPEKLEQGILSGLPDAEILKSDDRSRALIPALKGLVFLNHFDQLKIARPEVVGIDVSAVKNIDATALKTLLASYLGKPLSLLVLDKINQDISLHFRQQDYTVVDSIVPSNQDITDGVVQLIIMVGKMGKLTVKGGKYFSAERVKQSFSLLENDILKTSLLKGDLNWLNNNPFRSVNLALEAGDKVGLTNVQLMIEDLKPYRFYIGLENSGTELTGDNRLLLGANAGNVFGLEHQLNYQYSQDLSGKYLQAHALNYVIPLNWRHTLTLSLSDTVSTPKSALVGFDLEGKTSGYSLDYNIPLKNMGALKHDFSIAYHFKESNNNLQFGQSTVFNKFTEIAQFSFNYNASFVTDGAHNSLRASLVISPGGLTSKNDDEDFTVSRALAKADYQYLVLNATHSKKLSNDLLWALKAKLQLASNNLLGSEQMGIGGYSSIRGYNEFAVVGDKGLQISSQWTSEMTALKTSFIPNTRYQWLTFVETGIVNVIDPVANESSQTLSSIGGGLRFQFADNVMLRVDYGVALNSVDNNDDKGRLHIGLMADF